MTDHSGEEGHRREVDRAAGLLVQAARIDPLLRDAAVLVEQEVHRLRTALEEVQAACWSNNHTTIERIAKTALFGRSEP